MFYMHFIAFIYVFLDLPINKMPSASFQFSAVFRFRKSTQEIFSGLHGTKTHRHILPSRTRRPKERRRGAVEPPHHLAAWPHLPAREHMVWGSQASPGVTLCNIPSFHKSESSEKFKTFSNYMYFVLKRNIMHCMHHHLVLFAFVCICLFKDWNIIFQFKVYLTKLYVWVYIIPNLIFYCLPKFELCIV